jgi:2-hydroxychromene-2-carboxylate isomerase
MSYPIVQFVFDFGSPNAYLCHKVIHEIEGRTGVQVQYVPILLGGLFKLSNNRSPAEAFAGIPNKQAYDLLEVRRFIAKHRLDRFKRNPFFPVNTLQIMRGAVAAQKLDCFAAYVDAMYSAMWEQGRNMSDATEITAVLTSAGIDAARVLETTQDQSVKNGLLMHTQSAFERGAFGSPTFFVGDAMYFGKDRLREVEEEMLRLRGTTPPDTPYKHAKTVL